MGEETNDVTIACSLDPSQLAERRAVWEALARVALRALRPTADGVELVYAGSDESDETERLLRHLARFEGECYLFAHGPGRFQRWSRR